MSQMELHYEDEEEEEQSNVLAIPTAPANVAVQSTAHPDCSHDAQWDAGAVIPACFLLFIN